jgi:hypothetical protein
MKKKLYLGLGGAGSSSIAKIKANILEEYGEIPPSIKFLVIDVDGNCENHLASDYLHISINPNSFTEAISDEKINDWLLNSDGITASDMGARQIKSMGRFAYWLNQIAVEKAIKSKLIDLQSFNVLLDSKYDVEDSFPEVEMIYSSAGGTGAGIYLDLAWFIRRINSEIKINASIIMGSLFHDLHPNLNVNGNTYATLLEIDHLQSSKLNVNYNAHYLHNPSISYFKEEKLFDQICLFESQLVTGEILNKSTIIENIANMQTGVFAYSNSYDSNLFKSLLEDSIYKNEFKELYNKGQSFFIDSYFEKIYPL